jgi:hypothetical protein
MQASEQIVTGHVSEVGEDFFKKWEALQLEGMVMMRKNSVYAFMRIRDSPERFGPVRDK